MIASLFQQGGRGLAFRVRPHTGELTPYPFRRETWPKTEGNPFLRVSVQTVRSPDDSTESEIIGLHRRIRDQT